ncbi:MAG TPA: hypothetical protein VGE88_16585 [Lysobacter sp.]
MKADFLHTDFVRNVRLVASTTLLSIWGYSHLAATSVLGDTILPLLLALFIAPGANWFERRDNGGYRPWLYALAALVALTGLMFWAGTEQAIDAFAHSPWFVLPVWVLALYGLVRNATGAERSAAATRAASAAAHAPDVG